MDIYSSPYILDSGVGISYTFTFFPFFQIREEGSARMTLLSVFMV